MRKSLTLVAALCILAASCNRQEENLSPSVKDQGLQTEEAFIGRTGIVKEGQLFGSSINYMQIDNEKVFEGDIILTSGQLSSPESNERTEGTGRTRAASRWPGNLVYYTIDPALANQVRVTDAIKHWEANTPIRFAKRTTQANYVNFRTGSGCSSSVGMVGGVQYVNLATGCSTGNTIHEIGHALGLWHEQSRADRNNFIKILYENIETGYEGNFKTYLENGSDGFDHGALDFGSIMMYPSNAFSKNGLPTITKLNGSTFSTQRSALSSGDIACIKYMYPGTVSGSVTVYADCNFGGTGVSFAAGSYTLTQMQAKGALNDWLSSVKVPAGRSVVFYEHDNYTGASLTKTADDVCLVDDGWNDRVSSMIVK